MTGTVPVIL